MRAVWVSAATAALIGAVTLASPAFAQEAEDIDVVLQQKMTEFQQWASQITRETYDEAEHARFVTELLEDVDFSRLEVAHLGQLAGILGPAETPKAKLIERANTLAGEETVEGASAAVIAIQLRYGGGTDDVTAAVRRALDHPKIVDAIVDGSGSMALGYLPHLDEETLAAVMPQLVALGDALFERMPPEMAQQMIGYYEALLAVDLEAERLEAMRQRTVSFVTAASATMEAEMPGSGERLERALVFLDGAYARGQLIDHEAPALTFTWTNGEDGPATLADLQGKVVVLDFWATWCGPCIASFPNMLELQERYNGYDVVILGVTSLQGRHYPMDGEPIDCTDDPAREQALMTEFMESHGMTWDVAFSEQEVFNPEFGVRGIPHVAIVDAEGRVRFNGMHPMDPLPDKAVHIDELLTEAGLPVPAPLTASADDDEG